VQRLGARPSAAPQQSFASTIPAQPNIPRTQPALARGGWLRLVVHEAHRRVTPTLYAFRGIYVLTMLLDSYIDVGPGARCAWAILWLRQSC
jgi:hypothetical protein